MTMTLEEYYKLTLEQLEQMNRAEFGSRRSSSVDIDDDPVVVLLDDEFWASLELEMEEK